MKQYQKPELSIKSVVVKGKIAAEGDETVFSVVNPDDWFEWDN